MFNDGSAMVHRPHFVDRTMPAPNLDPMLRFLGKRKGDDHVPRIRMA
jgi:hypothetical protein